MQPWESEVDMSPAIARAVIEKEIKDFKVVEIKPFARGWDKTAYLVNNEILFHFTRRTIAIKTVETEIRFLPFIGKHLSVRVPEPIYSGYFQGHFPFFAYKLVEGVMAVDARLNHTQREKIAPDLAKILYELHRIPVTEKLKKVFPTDFMGKMNIEKRTGQILADWGVIRRLGLAIPSRFRDDLLSKVNQEAVKEKSCIVHGDLYSRHLMIKDGKISGIIDWGDMHINHPARDIAFAVNYFHPRAFGIFRTHYGEIDERTLCLAVFSALNHTLYVGEYALEINDLKLAEECRTGLRNMLDNYPS